MEGSEQYIQNISEKLRIFFMKNWYIYSVADPDPEEKSCVIIEMNKINKKKSVLIFRHSVRFYQDPDPVWKLDPDPVWICNIE